MGGGKGGGSSSKVEVINSGTTNVNSSSIVDIVGLDDINMRTELVVPDPIRTENLSRNEIAVVEPVTIRSDSNSRTELAITEPIVTDSTNRMALDIRPLVVDSCMRIEFGAIPPMHIHQPYYRHFGITLFGMEILGFNMSGEEQFIVTAPSEKPRVVGARPGAGQRHRQEAGRSETAQSRARGSRDSFSRESSGRLRIHLKS